MPAYYNNAQANGDFSDPNNWWSDVSYTTPLGAAPINGDIFIDGDVSAGTSNTFDTVEVGSLSGGSFTVDFSSLTATTLNIRNGCTLSAMNGATTVNFYNESINTVGTLSCSNANFYSGSVNSGGIMATGVLFDWTGYGPYPYSFSVGSTSGTITVNGQVLVDGGGWTSDATGWLGSHTFLFDTGGYNDTGTTHGPTVFQGTSYNQSSGTVPDGVVFKEDSYNQGVCLDAARFEDNAVNAMGGSVTGVMTCTASAAAASLDYANGGTIGTFASVVVEEGDGGGALGSGAILS